MIDPDSPAVIEYPGITNVLSLDFDYGHGIMPGTAVLVCDPAGFAPLASGSLEFGVPGSTITLIDCLYDMIRSERDRNDLRATAYIQDRRWRWKIGPPIWGHYNQIDDHGKLIPRTVRSPTQLAALCLIAMGETSFDIDLPPGLAAVPGDGIPPGSVGDYTFDPIAEYLKLGQNLPASGANIHVQWDGITAAQALSQLCDRFGRRVVPLLSARTTNIVPMGSGAILPDLPADSISASLDPSGIPANVVIVGAETPFQFRMMFRAVAEEWDGSHVPLPEVSYAPTRPAQKMRCRATGTWGAGHLYGVVINGVQFVTNAADAAGDILTVTTLLANRINASADPRIAGVVSASTVNVGSWQVQVDAIAFGVEFEFVAISTEGTWKAQCVRGFVPVDAAIPTVFQVKAVGPFLNADDYTITVNGVTFTRNGNSVPNGLGGFRPAVSYGDLLNVLAVDILSSANPAVQGKVSVGAWDRGLEIQSRTGPLTVTSSRTPTLDPFIVTGLETKQTQNGTDGRGFEYCTPMSGMFGFSTVEPTARLNWRQAMELASRSVFKRYQLVMVDPGDGSPGVKVPFLYDPLEDIGRVTESHRILLRETMPEQNAPRAGDVDRIDPITQQPYAATYYDGYSRNRPPRCFGSIFQGISSGGLYSAGGYLGANTMPRSEFYIPFRVIDPLRNIIEFAAPIYRILGSAGGSTGDVTVHPADLVVETGALVLQSDTQTPYRYLFPLGVPGGTGPDQGFPFDEVQVEYQGYYDDSHNLVGVSTVDDYGRTLAELLAVEVRSTFQVPAGRIIRFYEIQPGIVLTGQVWQIGYHIGRDGRFTTAGENTEFSRAIPPNAARRRLENLPPDPAQAQQNLTSSPIKNARNAVVNILRGIGL